MIAVFLTWLDAIFTVKFYIVSDMNGKVLDIEGGGSRVGGNVIMYQKNSPPSANQLWYFTDDGTIRSALNDFALEFQGNKNRWQ